MDGRIVWAVPLAIESGSKSCSTLLATGVHLNFAETELSCHKQSSLVGCITGSGQQITQIADVGIPAVARWFLEVFSDPVGVVSCGSMSASRG